MNCPSVDLFDSSICPTDNVHLCVNVSVVLTAQLLPSLSANSQAHSLCINGLEPCYFLRVTAL